MVHEGTIACCEQLRHPQRCDLIRPPGFACPYIAKPVLTMTTTISNHGVRDCCADVPR